MKKTISDAFVDVLDQDQTVQNLQCDLILMAAKATEAVEGSKKIFVWRTASVVNLTFILR